MRLSDLGQVDRLQRRRNVLLDLRRNMEIRGQVRGGDGPLGQHVEELSPELVAELKPVVEAALLREIVDIEKAMGILGVTVD